MKVMVVNREDKKTFVVYDNVKKVVDVFSSNGVYCHQIQVDDVYGTVATFPASEWKFMELKWVEMF